MKTLYLSIITILAISVVSSGMAYAESTSGPVLFMKPNSIGKIYANFTFQVLDNSTWNLEPQLSTSLSDPNSIASKDLTIAASPSSIIANKSNVPVTFTITAKNDVKGVYSLFLFFCGESPLAVGLNESEVNHAVLNQFFNARYMCPMMSVATPHLDIVGYSVIISKTISTIPINTNNVELQNIQVEPPEIKVGDAFTVNATLVNNSPNPITFSHGVCQGPFSVIFDNHVTVDPNQIICIMMAVLQKIEPGEKTTITSPGSALTYRATTAGTANATVTFSYFVRNQIDPNSPNIENTLSKSFLFTISDNNTGTKAPNETVLSPLKQFKSGIAPSNIQCKTDFALIFKAEDGSPACVTPTDAGILISRGWAKSQENSGIVVTLSEGQREGPLLIQKIFPDSVQGLEFREYPLATNVGIPITLHIGDSASNGCTVELTLVKISGGTTTFVKKENLTRLCPVCLSENTAIDTPEGNLNVKELRIGMQVWTLDNLGHKQAGTILKVGRTLVPPTHKMVHLILGDGRELFASPGHPTTDGRLLGDLKVGDILDNAKIKTVELVSYNENYTYDILPSGPTGFYWANGILLKSTLK